jgi:hypothetical protein
VVPLNFSQVFSIFLVYFALFNNFFLGLGGPVVQYPLDHHLILLS